MMVGEIIPNAFCGECRGQIYLLKEPPGIIAKCFSCDCILQYDPESADVEYYIPRKKVTGFIVDSIEEMLPGATLNYTGYRN